MVLFAVLLLVGLQLLLGILGLGLWLAYNYETVILESLYLFSSELPHIFSLLRVVAFASLSCLLLLLLVLGFVLTSLALAFSSSVVVASEVAFSSVGSIPVIPIPVVSLLSLL